jgi:hypothetical protein
MQAKCAVAEMTLVKGATDSKNSGNKLTFNEGIWAGLVPKRG